MDRAEIVHENFRRRVAAREFPAGARPAGPLGAVEAVAIYRAGCLSRALDRTSSSDAESRPGILHHRFFRPRGHGRGCVRAPR